MSDEAHGERLTREGSPVQATAAVVGTVFLLVGALGFVPGVTTDHGTLHAAGPHSHAELFGVFRVSILHNAVHLAFGVAGLLLARRMASARTYLVGGGAVYLLLWVYGLLVEPSSQANVVPLNAADNWLHLALGAGMLGLGVWLGRRSRALVAARAGARARA